MPRILGIDPGLRVTGYGLVELEAPEQTGPRRAALCEPRLIEAGVIRLDSSRALEHRLARLEADLGALIEQSAARLLAVEKLYAHYRHPRTAILMAHARGVILLCARQRGLGVAHLSATDVKKAITGYGHASKQQMQRAVQHQCALPEPPSPPDVADAIAIALTHGRRMALEQVNGR